MRSKVMRVCGNNAYLNRVIECNPALPLGVKYRVLRDPVQKQVPLLLNVRSQSHTLSLEGLTVASAVELQGMKPAPQMDFLVEYHQSMDPM